MLEYAPDDIKRLFLILFNLFVPLESFAFDECGQYGFFFYSDGYCYFLRPNNLTGIESYREFDPGTSSSSNRLQGYVMEKGESSYFWSREQKEKVVYYVKSHKSQIIQEKRCPGNFGGIETYITITLSEICYAVSGNKTFVNGFELKDVDKGKVLDVTSDAESAMILLLIRDGDDLYFFYTNNGTSKSGEISIKLPQGNITGYFGVSFQTCRNERFILIQNKKSKQIQIYVYSIPRIIKAIEQGDTSYPLHPTHSLEFKSLAKDGNWMYSIIIRYPYELQAFMFTLMSEEKWYLIVPDILYTAHIVTGCNVQDGRNGSRTAVCSESYSPFHGIFPFVYLYRLGVHTVLIDSSGPNETFIFQSQFVATCFLMNDCYGCHLAVFRTGQYCSWDGEKCSLSESQNPFKKCVSLRNMNENKGALEVNVKGVRLTNSGMKVHLLTAGEDKIENDSIQDHEVIFRPPESILANWIAGEIDLFLEIDNELIENSLVRLNLSNTSESPSDSQLIFWLIVLILIVLLLIFAFRKFSQHIRALQSSMIETSTWSTTQSNLHGVSKSPVEFSVWGRDTGFRASRTSTLEETIKREKEYSNAKKASTQSSDNT